MSNEWVWLWEVPLFSWTVDTVNAFMEFTYEVKLQCRASSGGFPPSQLCSSLAVLYLPSMSIFPCCKCVTSHCQALFYITILTFRSDLGHSLVKNYGTKSLSVISWVMKITFTVSNPLCGFSSQGTNLISRYQKGANAKQKKLHIQGLKVAMRSSKGFCVPWRYDWHFI